MTNEKENKIVPTLMAEIQNRGINESIGEILRIQENLVIPETCLVNILIGTDQIRVCLSEKIAKSFQIGDKIPIKNYCNFIIQAAPFSMGVEIPK
jgi:hypothetical protein